jgi:FAD synthase
MKQDAGIVISGKVVKGDGYGRKLGFPTANLDRRQYVRLKQKPKLGVWAGVVHYQLKAKSYKLFPAGIVIGPIDKNGLPKLEAHLIGFKGNLYGKKITLSLNKFLRKFQKYTTEEALKQQIKKDINKIKVLISK